MHRLTQLARRRSELVIQIGHSRRDIKSGLVGARKEIMLAGFGFIVTRILANHPTLRAIFIIALAVSKKETILERLGLKGLFAARGEARE
jgi:hypothetical protein